MNQVLEIIRNRFSCRAFLDQPLSEQQLHAITEAANQSPSAMNLQPWQIIAVRNPQLLGELEAEGMRVLSAMEDKTMYERIQSRGGKLFYNAPCAIYIPQEANTPSAPLDCGIVAQTIALAAQSLGLGSCICGMARLSFSPEKAAYFKEALHFPPGYEFGIAILLGTPVAEGTAHEPNPGKITYLD